MLYCQNNLIFNVFLPNSIEQVLPFFSVIYKIGRKSCNFLKFDNMTIIFLSTFVMNTVEDNRQASHAFTIKHSCHINLFYEDRFGTYCSGCILWACQNCYPELERSVSARSLAVGVRPILECHPSHPSKEIDTPAPAKVQRCLPTYLKHYYIVQKPSTLYKNCNYVVALYGPVYLNITFERICRTFQFFLDLHQYLWEIWTL